MTPIFNRTQDYSLKVILLLSRNSPGRLFPARELANELDMHRHYLAKVLQNLTQLGLLSSHRGPQGGYELAAGVADLSLLDLMEQMGCTSLLSACPMGIPGCGGDGECPICAAWAPAREAFLQRLALLTVKTAAYRRDEFSMGNQTREDPS